MMVVCIFMSMVVCMIRGFVQRDMTSHMNGIKKLLFKRYDKINKQYQQHANAFKCLYQSLAHVIMLFGFLHFINVTKVVMPKTSDNPIK